MFLALAGIALGERQLPRADTNGIGPDEFAIGVGPGHEVCQANVVVSEDATGARVFVKTYHQPGPALELLVRDGFGRIVRRGGLEDGYADSSWQVVRFASVDRTGRDYALCFRSARPVAIAGTRDPNRDPHAELREDGRSLGVDLAYELVREPRESLLGLVPTIFRRASLFRPGWIGPWTYYVAVLVLLLAGALAAGATIAATRGASSGRAQLASVAAVALLNALIWSVVMPSFQPPDEAAHYSYVASLAELHRRPYTDPSKPGGSHSAETNLALIYTAVGIVEQPERRPPWTQYEEDEYEAQNETIARRQPDLVGGGWTTVAAYSPLYYALAAPFYAIAEDASVFTRLWLMRVASALMMAGTAVLAFLIGRELLPRISYAGVVSGMAVALQPMLAQLGGAVNNDNLLILLGSLELYLLVRVLQRGLTLVWGVAVGIVLGLGIMAKPNMYAFVPVLAFALGWIIVHERRGLRAIALPVALAVVAAGLVTAGSYAAFHQDEFVAGTATPTGDTGGSLRALFSYLWQWYIPGLSFMRDFWPPTGVISVPAWDIYFRGFWADFAHLDTEFPDWVYVVLAVVSLSAVPAIVMAVVRQRERRSVLAGQVLVLASAVAATALLVTYRSYLALIQSNVQPFAQGRYLLQTVVVVGAVVALAARGLGPRWGPVAAAALVTALFGLNVFSLGLVLTRFYT